MKQRPLGTLKQNYAFDTLRFWRLEMKARSPLRALVVSPRFHRWHHTDEANARDKNFAGLLPSGTCSSAPTTCRKTVCRSTSARLLLFQQG